MFEDIKPLQEKQLLILKEFKRVCDLNGLDYFLAFGTLLGAIRHKGYIPWDDDIDVCMNYKDYEKLDKACKEDLGEGFFLQSDTLDPESHMTYKKLRLDNTTCIHENHASKNMHHGIGIDIYPVFHVANNKIAQRIQIVSAIVYLLLVEDRPPRNHGRVMKAGATLILLVLSKRMKEKLKQHCFKKMTKYENVETNYRAMFYGNAKNCMRVYPAYMFEGRTNKVFENEQFKVPKEYDAYLSFRYGDYMKLPPVEEQGVKLDHLVKVDVNNPYTIYKGKYYCVDNKQGGEK